MKRKTEFLYYFYRVFAICGAVGMPIGFLIGGADGLLSFILGLLSIALIVVLWHLTLHFTLKPRKTGWAWESLMVFLRYILLGGLFYAMISLFAVRWFWYLAGTTMILPGLLITTLLYDKETTRLD